MIRAFLLIASLLFYPQNIECKTDSTAETLNAVDPSFMLLCEPMLLQAQELSDSYQTGNLKKIPILAIGGCPGVGKTVFAEKMKRALQEKGIQAAILKMDDFIKDTKTRSEYGTGWDIRHFDAQDLHQTMLKITSEEKKISKPTLSEVTREKGSEVLDLQGVTLLIVEGLYALSTESSLGFFDYANLGVYLEANLEDVYMWRWERELKKRAPKTPEHFKRHMDDIIKDFILHVATTKSVANYIITKDQGHNYTGLLTRDSG